MYSRYYSNSMRCTDFFFFKQKTAYEMRISDWSSDVCSSDLAPYRAEVEDRRTRLHHAHGGAAKTERRLQTELNGLVERGIVNLVNSAELERTRVIDQAVESTKALHRRIDTAITRVALRDVDRDGLHVGNVSQRLGEFGEPLLPSRHRDDAEPTSRETPHDALADSRACARHQHDRLVRRCSLHSRPPLSLVWIDALRAALRRSYRQP